MSGSGTPVATGDPGYAMGVSRSSVAGFRVFFLLLVLAWSGIGRANPSGADTLWQLPYPLVSESGQVLHLSQWSGRPAIVTMEYSQSSLVCSVTLAYLKELQDLLDARGQSADFVIISLDPANDTPQAWTRYREKFGLARTNWHFLTASEADTPAIAKALNVKYRRYDDLIIHRLRVMRLDREGQVANVLRSHFEDLNDFLDQAITVR